MRRPVSPNRLTISSYYLSSIRRKCIWVASDTIPSLQNQLSLYTLLKEISLYACLWADTPDALTAATRVLCLPIHKPHMIWISEDRNFCHLIIYQRIFCSHGKQFTRSYETHRRQFVLGCLLSLEPWLNHPRLIRKILSRIVTFIYFE